MYWTKLIVGNILIVCIIILWFWVAGKLLDMIGGAIDDINKELSESLNQLQSKQ